MLINHRNSHWFLGFIDLIAKRVFILDSIISSSDFYTDYKIKLFKVTKAVCNIDSRNLNFAEFKFCIPSKSPQQLATSNDCGIFVCNFIEFIVDQVFKMRNFSFSSEFKRFLINRIICNAVNTQSFQQNLDRKNRRTFTNNSLNNVHFSLRNLQTLPNFNFENLKPLETATDTV